MKKVLCKTAIFMLVFTLIFANIADVCALNIVFKGKTDTFDTSVTIALYKPDADINNISASDISYINQQKINDDGSFEISLPVSLLTATSSKVVSNIKGKLLSDEIPLYASQNGTDNGDGTKEKPYTLQKALEEVVDNGKIIVDGLVLLDTDFVWPESDKTIIISGENNAVIDIKTLDHLQINCNTTFENLTFGCAQTGTGEDIMPENTISANGYHVIIKESVETENILSIRGGSTSKAVDGTHLEVYGGHYKTIYGGGSAHNVNGDCILTVGGQVNKNYDTSDTSSNYVPTAIHGGCWGGAIKGDCITT
ncbi:MAG: hypothetical protein E7404_09065, partial [Ruminococcaceae bacterium]|nr:hypothetical protein [Oscillospiraceae bacterium]